MKPLQKNRESYYTASQWQLFWSRFKANRLAAIGGAVLGIFIVISLFAEFIAPYSGLADSRDAEYPAGPTQMVHICDDADCRWPFVYEMTSGYNVINKSYSVLAARLSGANGWRIITRHLLPGFASYIIVELVINFP